MCGSTLQHGAYLECEVLNTTLATVKWIRNGTAITESSKYFLGVSNLEEDITVYILVVRKLMEDDFGEYICQVGSDYRDLEDEKSVQILAPKPGRLKCVLIHCVLDIVHPFILHKVTFQQQRSHPLTQVLQSQTAYADFALVKWPHPQLFVACSTS